jgi:hypothetical protein
MVTSAVDLDHLTDGKHIWIYINYNGKFDEVINIYDETIGSY